MPWLSPPSRPTEPPSRTAVNSRRGDVAPHAGLEAAFAKALGPWVAPSSGETRLEMSSFDLIQETESSARSVRSGLALLSKEFIFRPALGSNDFSKFARREVHRHCKPRRWASRFGGKRISGEERSRATDGSAPRPRGEAHVQRQREIVTKMWGPGAPTDIAVTLLEAFQDTLRQHKAHLGRIEARDDADSA
jgi:hypothetical protein